MLVYLEQLILLYYSGGRGFVTLANNNKKKTGLRRRRRRMDDGAKKFRAVASMSRPVSSKPLFVFADARQQSPGSTHRLIRRLYLYNTDFFFGRVFFKCVHRLLEQQFCAIVARGYII